MKLIATPTICPVCGQPLIIDNSGIAEVLKCVNYNCPAKLEGRLIQFVGKNGLDIESISEKTIKALISLGWLNNLSDIFTLKDHRDEWVKLNGFGEGSVDKILEGIPTSVEMWRIIASAGIPDINKHIGQLLEEKFEGDWDAFRRAVITGFDFSRYEGIGAVTAKNLAEFDYSEIDKVMSYLTIRKTNVDGKIAHKTFCITGKLESMKRDDFIKLIEENGGKFASVGKGLDFLICNDKDSGSSKMQKAKKLGITVITEAEFMEMIK